MPRNNIYIIAIIALFVKISSTENKNTQEVTPEEPVTQEEVELNKIDILSIIMASHIISEFLNWTEEDDESDFNDYSSLKNKYEQWLPEFRRIIASFEANISAFHNKRNKRNLKKIKIFCYTRYKYVKDIDKYYITLGDLKQVKFEKINKDFTRKYFEEISTLVSDEYFGIFDQLNVYMTRICNVLYNTRDSACNFIQMHVYETGKTECEALTDLKNLICSDLMIVCKNSASIIIKSKKSQSCLRFIL